jgi:hypothetical protein
MRSRRPFWPHVAFATFCACALAALIWPVYPALGNKIEPSVLGLPFSLAWIVAWVVASFLALVAYEWGVRRPAERGSASSTVVTKNSESHEA